MRFDYNLNFKDLNFKQHPELYRVGKGEQGVLLIEPYKSELLHLWKFRTPADAKKSAQQLLRAFYSYRKDLDFAGMDMARKFLQMGYTRSRRYANHRSGKKYFGPVPVKMKGKSGAHGRTILPNDEDKLKAKSAAIFQQAWRKADSCKIYRHLKSEWKLWYG